MNLDRVFWIWFAFVGFVSVYLLLIETSIYGFLFPLILIGLGLDRLADEREGRNSVKVANKLLNKLKINSKK